MKKSFEILPDMNAPMLDVAIRNHGLPSSGADSLKGYGGIPNADFGNGMSGKGSHQSWSGGGSTPTRGYSKAPKSYEILPPFVKVGDAGKGCKCSGQAKNGSGSQPDRNRAGSTEKCRGCVGGNHAPGASFPKFGNGIIGDTTFADLRSMMEAHSSPEADVASALKSFLKSDVTDPSSFGRHLSELGRMSVNALSSGVVNEGSGVGSLTKEAIKRIDGKLRMRPELKVPVGALQDAATGSNGTPSIGGPPCGPLQPFINLARWAQDFVLDGSPNGRQARALYRSCGAGRWDLICNALGDAWVSACNSNPIGSECSGAYNAWQSCLMNPPSVGRTGCMDPIRMAYGSAAAAAVEASLQLERMADQLTQICDQLNGGTKPDTSGLGTSFGFGNAHRNPTCGESIGLLALVLAFAIWFEIVPLIAVTIGLMIAVALTCTVNHLW